MQATLAKTPLQRLQDYLVVDPDNLRLLSDAVQAAIDEGALDEAESLIDRYAALAPLPANLVNCAGLVALQSGRIEDAVSIFTTLQEAQPAEPGLRFNLAWALSLQRDFEGADRLLDDATLEVAPAARGLKITVMHHLGRLEDALTLGEQLAEKWPHEVSLLGPLSLVALDAEQPELAGRYAQASSSTAAGAAVLGNLAIGRGAFIEAETAFDNALEREPGNPRALLGKGLTRLAGGDASLAAPAIEEAAAVFQTHLGSWVAAAWARLIDGDPAAARRLFEKAQEVDDTFAEIHGGLAVLDILQGDTASGRTRIDVARRLDRNCFSAALAQSLLLSQAGDVSGAQRIQELALNFPVGPNGETLAALLAAMRFSAR